MLADHAPPALEFARLNSWPWRDRTAVTWIDWRTSHLEQTFDLIVGADILYDRHDIPFLRRFWRQHLVDGGEVLLTEPARLMTLDLLPLVRSADWSIQQTAHLSPPLTKPINVFRLSML